MPHFEPTISVNEDVLCAVMSTVYYFDIFKHPLREHELLELTHHRTVSREELSSALNFLITNDHLHLKNGYYLPHSGFENISRRIKGAIMAEKSWKIAKQKSKLISRFPFVRCVLISGSLSKGFMDERSDIDYLIITRPGRLWLARTLLVAYKKIFLLNSHKFFCVNYFLDVDHLILHDRNLFTATELLFATPLYNPGMYAELLSSNEWAKIFYPSLAAKNYTNSIPDQKHGSMKQISERVLNGKMGDLLDNLCMKISNHFWKIKFNKMNRVQYQRDMKSGKGVSKHHPNGFRDRILNEHRNKMELFMGKLKLSSEFQKTYIQPVYHS
jgi:predicted nucleotidyltransferase